MRIVFLSFFFTIFLSCSNDSWSKKEKDEFIEGCKGEGGGTHYCNCFMNEVMQAYPKFEEANNISLEEAVELASKCEQ